MGETTIFKIHIWLHEKNPELVNEIYHEILLYITENWFLLPSKIGVLDGMYEDVLYLNGYGDMTNRCILDLEDKIKEITNKYIKHIDTSTIHYFFLDQQGEITKVKE